MHQMHGSERINTKHLVRLSAAVSTERYCSTLQKKNTRSTNADRQYWRKCPL